MNFFEAYTRGFFRLLEVYDFIFLSNLFFFTDMTFEDVRAFEKELQKETNKKVMGSNENIAAATASS